jgi:DNA polymerase-3 subunit beta
MILSTAKLLHAVASCGAIATTNSQAPILSHILLRSSPEGETDKLHIIANNLEMAWQIVFATEDTDPRFQEETAGVTVEAKRLHDILKTLPPKSTIALTLDNDQLLLKYQRNKFKLPTRSGTEFPQWNDESSSSSVTVIELPRILSTVAYAAAQQDVRFYLQSVYLEIGQREIHWVGTDGHRLATLRTDLPEDKPDYIPWSGLIPNKVIPHLIRHTDGKYVHLTGSKGQLRVEFATHTLGLNNIIHCRLIEGTYPNWRRVVPAPESQPGTIKVEGPILLEAVHRVAAIGHGVPINTIRVSLDIENQQLRLYNRITETSAEADASIDCECEHPWESAFNAKYLLDAIKAADQENLFIHHNDESSSIVIRPVAKDTVTQQHIVMPSRI